MRLQHPIGITRRGSLQAGAIGLLGLGTNHLTSLQAMADGGASPRAKSCIFIFLSGGLAQHESFDLKPQASDTVRGEFLPIATETPGIEICEHLPRLAACSSMWSLCRSLTHRSNEHSEGHHIMLTGRSETPPASRPTSRPRNAGMRRSCNACTTATPPCARPTSISCCASPPATRRASAS